MRTILLGAALIFGTAAVFSTSLQKSPAAYAGNDACIKCHKMRNKKIVEGQTASPLAHAMVPITMSEMIEGDFSKAPIKKEDVAWALCTGRHEQAYLDKDLKVLPAVWDADKKEWHERPSIDAAKECLGCHTVGFNPEKRTWASIGVGCESCHGPNLAHSKNATTDSYNPTKVAKLSVVQQSMICGSCHSAGKAKSGSAYLSGYSPGTDLNKVWEFSAEPLSSGRSQRYNEWRDSKHAAKVSCVGCHDPHNTTGIARMLRKPAGELCRDCHAPQADQAKHAPDAKPDDTCVSCHMPGFSHKLGKVKPG